MFRKSVWIIAVSLLFFGMLAGCAGPQPRYEAEQPRMRAALAHLREARRELELAAPNKGGHRERAIELADNAIKQVELGIEFAERHRRY